jgi:tetratricopeptide (TPR) repeat protein
VMRVRSLSRITSGAALVAGAFLIAGCITDQPMAGSDAVSAATPPAVPGAPYPVELAAAGPDTQEGVPPLKTPTIRQNADAQYYPSDEPLRLGMEYFNRGNFGLAERYFRDAVEKAPRDASAWIGLAASYDRVGRFDLADRAYHSAIQLVGETTALLNNRGYSYMLRGDLKTARRYFLRAYKREPGNPTIINNLKLLDGSGRFIQRSPDAL